jgi:hypothetical protein
MGDALVIILVFATFGVLIAGVVLMAMGGKANAKYGNALMRWRVMLQGAALLLIALLFFMGKS